MSAVTIGAALAVIFAASTGLAATSLGCQTEMAGNSPRTPMDMPMPGDGAPADQQQPCDEPSTPTACQALAPCATVLVTPSIETIAFVAPTHSSRFSDHLLAPESRDLRPALPPPRA